MASYDNLKAALFDDETMKFKDYGVKYSSRAVKNCRYMKADDLNKHIKKYIRSKIQNEQLETDRENNINIHYAHNAFYIDLDYEMTTNDEDEQKNLNDGLLKVFIDAFNYVAKQRSIKKYYYLPFTPIEFTHDETNDVYKGGSHTMIMSNKIFTKNERKEIYNEIIKYVVNNYEKYKICVKYIRNEKKYDIDELFRHVFDETPIINANLLIPFAQKSSTSRQYMLRKELLWYHNQDWFVFDREQDKDDTTGNTEDVKISCDDLMDNSPVEILPDPSYVFGKEAKLIYDFVSSFKYLSKNHPIWEKLFGDHNEYYYKFVGSYYKILIMFNMFNATNMKDFERYTDKSTGRRIQYKPFEMIGKLVAKQLSTLCMERDDYPPNSKRPVFIEQFKNIDSMIIKPFEHDLTSERMFTKLLEENGGDDVDDDEENDDLDDDYIEDIEFETPQINFEQIDETEIEEDSEEEDEEDI